MSVNISTVMKADQERVKVLLTDTVTLLCRNGLHFQKQLRVQGVLGITVDDTDVFIVHINESFNEQQPPITRIAEDQANESYYLSSIVGNNVPQFTQNPDGTLQMISGGQVSRVNNVTANQKHKCSDGGGDDGRAKRQKADPTGIVVSQNQYAGGVQCLSGGLVMHGGKVFSTCTPLPQNSNDYQGNAGVASATGGVVTVKDEKRKQQGGTVGGVVVAGGASGQVLQQQQWQFATTAAAKSLDKIGVAAGGTAVIDPVQCYVQYTTAGGCIDDLTAGVVGGVSGTGGGGGGAKAGTRKVGVYPSLSVPTVSFVTNMASVDFNAGGASNSTVVQTTNARGESVAQSLSNKLWEAQQQQQQQQQQITMFDPMTSPWTMSQLMTTQGLLTAEEQQQAQDSIQNINQLGMLGYTTTAATVGQQQVVTTELVSDDGGGGGDLQASRGSKESRRSWTSKHKPHTCQHPSCRKSYFFVHDLRRHLRQKHDGMDFNGGKYEPTSEGEGMGEGDIGHESPMDGRHHECVDGVGETDDGSPDESDDNEEDDVMAMALTGGGGVGGGKEVVT